MTKQTGNNAGTPKSGLSGRSGAEEAFTLATELHQRGDITGALKLYQRLIERFESSPKAELAKTLVAGIQKEKVGVLLTAALNARSQCIPAEAMTLYQRIIADFPDSAEGKNALAEMLKTGEIAKAWDEAIAEHAKGNEMKAIEAYRRLVERFPGTPEAENAGVLMAIASQNQLLQQNVTAPAQGQQQDTPDKIVAHLLSHKKAAENLKGDPSSEAAREEAKSKAIENIWMQAVALEKDGKTEEALILYRDIIATSANGHRVRDAKYRAENIKARADRLAPSFDQPQQWGLEPAQEQSLLQRLMGWKVLASLAVVIALAVVAFMLARPSGPAKWTDIVEAAKKSIVVVRTPDGAGSGFLISRDGLIVTNAHLAPKDKDIDVRLYSGVLKRATIVKTGNRILDIAILRIDGTYDSFLAMAGEDECREGSEIRVLGAPLGMEYFVTKGMISHCNQDRDGVRYIQTDPAINLGNSGGPGLNNTGKVIGISTSLPVGNNAETIGIIIPSTVIRDFQDGKLVALEEALMKKEEERAREAEEKRKKIYEDIEIVNKRLQQASETERAAYYAKINDLINRSRITTQQAGIMVDQVKYGPSGSTPMTEWVQSLAVKVSKGEMSEEAAVMLIKGQYKM
ncbi:MAG: trypsin-like peptidase domain-containing protein [Nitrospiraceae bacterium]|nr:trypsin-like peptidase domain-containing protein [Nitrospiraceae bacterium]